MFLEAGEGFPAPGPARPDREALHRVCEKIDQNATPRTVLGGFTWLQGICADLERNQATLRELSPYYPYLDAEGIAAIERVSKHFFNTLMLGRGPGFDLSIKGMPNQHDLVWVEKYLFSYWTALVDLDDYCRIHIDPFV